jgi:hypothetical protein
MWSDDPASPRSYISIGETPTFTIDLLSPHRCFLWVLFVPLPKWGSCSPTVEVPDRHVVFLRLTNKTPQPVRLLSAPAIVELPSNTLQIPISEGDRFLDADEARIIELDLGPWSEIGWGYTIDLSGPLGSPITPVFVERFTSTTFGLMLLD